MRRPGRGIATALSIALGAGAGLGVVLNAQGQSGSAGEGPVAASQDGTTIGTVSPNPPAGPAVGPEPEPSPPPPLSTMTIDGQRFTLPSVVGRFVDLDTAHVAATEVNRRSYVVGNSLRRPGTCFIEVPTASDADPVIGCDTQEDLVAKGGWLIFHRGAGADARSGLLILPPGYTASSGSAGSRPLEASGRAVVFRDLPASIRRVDATTAEGRRFSVSFP